MTREMRRRFVRRCLLARFRRRSAFPERPGVQSRWERKERGEEAGTGGALGEADAHAPADAGVDEDDGEEGEDVLEAPAEDGEVLGADRQRLPQLLVLLPIPAHPPTSHPHPEGGRGRPTWHIL